MRGFGLVAALVLTASILAPDATAQELERPPASEEPQAPDESGEDSGDDGESADSDDSGEAEQEPARPWESVDVDRLAGDTRVRTAVEISREAFSTATVALLSRSDEFADALVGAPLAAHLSAPLLLNGALGLQPEVSEELDRLGVEQIVLLGGHRALSRTLERDLGRRYTVRRIAGEDRYDTAARVAAELPDGEQAFVTTGQDFPDALAAAPVAAASAAPILLTAPDGIPAATSAAVTAIDPPRIVVVGGRATVSDGVVATFEAEGREVRRLAGANRYETALAVAEEGRAASPGSRELWLATAHDFPDALAAGPAVAAAGATLLLVDGADLLRMPVVTDRLRAWSDEIDRVVLLGGPAALNADAATQAQRALWGPLLPRGGHRLFPAFRIVAYYGGHWSPRLGVLGEGTPDQAADAVMARARDYDQEQRPVLPAFELIATIATRASGSDGMYRSVAHPDDVQRYLDAARRMRGLLILDIQPGRSDFLTEVRRYERFLVEPDVGVALDPEWRMGPNQVPGQTVGQVDAAEVNAVSAYLADLAARHRLPEKLLIVHQFQNRMITSKDRLVARDGLALTIHMDGFGSRAQKLDTYRHVQVEAPLWNGFKLFYDEDTNLFEPHELLELDPPPDFVSYQ